MTNNKLTKDNYVATMLKEIKHYPKEPFYYFYVGNSLCTYEILVNDLTIQNSFKYEQQATPIYINMGILKSGKQKVTYRIYPAPAEYNGGKDVFDPETEFRVTVYVNDNARGLQVGEETLITEYKAPTKIRMAGSNNDIALTEFEGKGQKYYENSFYFDAEVPYTNEGWSNGQDLTKVSQKDLEKAVVNFYQKQWNIINDKKQNDIFSYLFIKEKEINQSEYSVEKELIENVEYFLKPFKANEYKLQPIENYKLAFYGDGKMVSLELTSLETKLRKKSALWAKYKTESGNSAGNFRNYKLYLPKGKSLNELQVIR